MFKIFEYTDFQISGEYINSALHEMYALEGKESTSKCQGHVMLHCSHVMMCVRHNLFSL